LKAVKFNKRARKPEELVATYVVELHALSQQYNFSETLEKYNHAWHQKYTALSS